MIVNCQTHVYDVYIGRRGPWGNPFRIGRDGTREDVISKYRVWLWEQIQDEEIDLRELAKLDGQTLGCHCAPLPCHGDVLARAAAWAVAELAHRAANPCGICGTNPCCFQCPNSPHYYSPEREKSDALHNDSLSYDQWFREAVDQYERVHGEPYVS